MSVKNRVKMKLIRALKNNVFSMKNLFSKNSKVDKENHNENIDKIITNDDELFVILNIGNHEYNKNKPYIVDEIEYRIDQNETASEIAHFISHFIKKTYSMKIKIFQLENWIKTTYKQKLDANKNNKHRHNQPNN